MHACVISGRMFWFNLDSISGRDPRRGGAGSPSGSQLHEQRTQRWSRDMSVDACTGGVCGPQHARAAGSLLERLFAAMGGLDGLFPGVPS